MSAQSPGFPEPPARAWRPATAAPIGSAIGFVAALVGAGPLLRIVPRSAPPPGYAALHGIDPRREVVRWLLFLALPVAGGFIAASVAKRDRVGGGAAPSPMPERPVPVRLWPAAVAAHAIVGWIFATAAFPALVLRSPAIAFAAAASLSAGLALVLGRGRIEEGVVWLGAAVAVLPLAFVGHRPIPLAAAGAVAAFALPAAACALGSRRVAPARVLRAVVVSVLVPGSVSALAAAAILGAPPVADLFENGHELLPASEYLRGERPYRDIVPGHGLLSDGGLDAIGMRAFGDDYRGYVRGRKLVGAAFWPAFYGIGLAASGSPAVGLGVALLSLSAFCQYSFPRLIGSFAALAISIAASRAGSRRMWAVAGAAVTLACFLSVDFGVYAAGAAVAALWVSRGDRSAMLAAAAAGAAAAAAPAILLLAALGVLPEFARITFFFLPSLLPAYAHGLPNPFRFDDASATATYAAAAAAVVLLGSLLPLGKRVTDAARPLAPICAWIALAMAAVLERRHTNYPFFAVPAAVVLLARWIRRSSADRVAGNAAAGAIVLGFAAAHGAFGLPRVLAGAAVSPFVDSDVAWLEAPPRAAGAVFRSPDRALVARTAEMIERAGFGPDDTWLDFANEPGLYFFFDRPCPIRYYEVGFYESEAAQREVIAAIRDNPRVRAVLMSGTYPTIDGVPNAKRAPLVAAFIAEQFRPFSNEEGIEFWIRDDDRGRAAARP